MKSWLLLVLGLSTYTGVFAAQVPKAADVSVAGVGLLDGLSTRKVLGANVKIDSGVRESHAIYENKMRTEKLVLTMHPGSNQDEFSEIEVATLVKTGRAPALDVASFRSGKGIHLGMSKKQVIAILGEPSEIEKKATAQVLKYSIREQESPEFFAPYNLPEYVSEYEFKGGKLARFSVGFVYP